MGQKPEAFHVTARQVDEGKAVVKVAGEVHGAAAELLAEMLTTAITSYEVTVLELSDCRYMDSSGLSVLLAAAQYAVEARHTLRLAAVQPELWRAIELTGTYSLPSTYPNAAAALDSE